MPNLRVVQADHPAEALPCTAMSLFENVSVEEIASFNEEVGSNKQGRSIKSNES